MKSDKSRKSTTPKLGKAPVAKAQGPRGSDKMTNMAAAKKKER